MRIKLDENLPEGLAVPAALLSSLYELVAPTPTEWEAVWDRECADRLSAYRRGALDAVDSTQAMQELRRKHGLE